MLVWFYHFSVIKLIIFYFIFNAVDFIILFFVKLDYYLIDY